MLYKFRGEITTALALMLSILLAFVGVVIESARAQAVRAQTERVMQIGLHSCFGEFNKDLWEKYDLLAVDCSYRAAKGSEERFAEHLKEYASVNFTEPGADAADWLKMQVEKVALQEKELLSDGEGGALYTQATEMMAEYGMPDGRDYKKLASILSVWEQSEFMEGYEEALEHVGEAPFNPAREVYDIVTTNDILDLIQIQKPEGKMISSPPSKRTLRKGNGGRGEGKDDDFYAYLVKHFGCCVKPVGHGVWECEQEYLISGKSTEEAALRTTVKRILTQREEDNLNSLYHNASAVRQAEAYAAMLCVEGDPEALKEALLYAWACGEAVIQVSGLIHGGRVTMEGNQVFVLPLEELVDFLDYCGGGYRGDQDYREYLCGLLAGESMKKLRFRCMDLLEMNMQAMGHKGFLVDDCIVRVTVRMDVQSDYGYDYNIIRSFGYQ